MSGRACRQVCVICTEQVYRHLFYGLLYWMFEVFASLNFRLVWTSSADLTKAWVSIMDIAPHLTDLDYLFYRTYLFLGTTWHFAGISLQEKTKQTVPRYIDCWPIHKPATFTSQLTSLKMLGVVLQVTCTTAAWLVVV